MIICYSDIQTKTIHILLSVNLINSDALIRNRYPVSAILFLVRCLRVISNSFFFIIRQAVFIQSSIHIIIIRIAN